MEDQASDTDEGNEQDPRLTVQPEEEALPKRRPNNYRPEPLEQTWEDCRIKDSISLNELSISITLIRVGVARRIRDNTKEQQNGRPNKVAEVVGKKKRKECRRAVGTEKKLESDGPLLSCTIRPPVSDC